VPGGVARLLRSDQVHVVVDVELLPGRRDHVINERFFLVGPVLGHFAQVEAIDDLIGVHERVHVRIQSVSCVSRLDVELYLNEVFRVRSNHEVHVVPVVE